MCILDVICLRFEPHMCFVPRLPVLRHRAMRKYCILRASQGKHQIQKVTKTTMLHLKHVSKYIYIYLHICNICILYRPLSPPPPGCHQQRGRHYGRFSRPIFHPILNLYQFIAIYTLSMGISDAHHHFVPRVESCS
jgi:hypothetical protein